MVKAFLKILKILNCFLALNFQLGISNFFNWGHSQLKNENSKAKCRTFFLKTAQKPVRIFEHPVKGFNLNGVQWTPWKDWMPRIVLVLDHNVITQIMDHTMRTRMTSNHLIQRVSDSLAANAKFQYLWLAYWEQAKDTYLLVYRKFLSGLVEIFHSLSGVNKSRKFWSFKWAFSP